MEVGLKSMRKKELLPERHLDRCTALSRFPEGHLPFNTESLFLRVDPDAENAKQALGSTLIGYNRDWERDLIPET
jgi:hypothetical protein